MESKLQGSIHLNLNQLEVSEKCKKAAAVQKFGTAMHVAVVCKLIEGLGGAWRRQHSEVKRSKGQGKSLPCFLQCVLGARERGKRRERDIYMCRGTAGTGAACA